MGVGLAKAIRQAVPRGGGLTNLRAGEIGAQIGGNMMAMKRMG
ncbi:hypothetical protein [Geobacillus sp. JS12]|nr:hypothetical protein [Geobacillus sp. JS12]